MDNSISQPWWKISFGIKGRNGTIELAKFGLACMVFFTHIVAFTSLQVGHEVLARTFRSIGSMSTLTFAAISGYYLIGKEGKGRWLQVLFTMLILLILNWLVTVIGLSIRGYVWLGSSVSHRVTTDMFWGSALGRHGWLNALVVGNDIHWYMWQFAIAVALYPVVSAGLVKMSKYGYLAFAVGFLALNVVIKVVVLANFEENTLGGFFGFYGRANAMIGGDGAPYSGYNWILLLFMMILAGWFKLHYIPSSKYGMLWFLAALVLIVILAVIWKYSNHNIQYYNSARGNGYPGPYKTNDILVPNDINQYNAWLTTHPDGTINQFAIDNPQEVSMAFEQTNSPSNTTDYKNWFAKQYAVSDSYGITWLGTFLEGGNYIPVASLFGSAFIFLGIIHLPHTDIKIGKFLGGISYAYYFMHMDAMSWTAQIFDKGFGIWNGSSFEDASSFGFTYLAFMMISWVIALPYGILGTYGTRLGMKFTANFWKKYFGPKKSVLIAQKT